ncbi:hypothetical protein SARC_15863 [Sphaeroforma arctica JP610]|uniref:EF-hand domain-containing protein n=1 Tax=Sphaeroforma arctica JP610 TaxID=667725 RepID=A0A0L0F4K5_9EUKA|nr:hypothetical protein SARC_15863 [Sphaeroforma arctica JP610]KNC71597.1 hypothetical protein SARC_15863 [Sphaeroforma arctica JP610]|eukprot:XP_014145499.1 hypothetical protein SARC_15863 [Sphaeroforma arctica JP610]
MLSAIVFAFRLESPFFDKDNSGKLDNTELDAALAMVTTKIPGCPTLPASVSKSIMAKIDINKDGSCTKEEFHEFTKQYLHQAKKQESVEEQKA